MSHTDHSSHSASTTGKSAISLPLPRRASNDSVTIDGSSHTMMTAFSVGFVANFLRSPRIYDCLISQSDSVDVQTRWSEPLVRGMDAYDSGRDVRSMLRIIPARDSVASTCGRSNVRRISMEPSNHHASYRRPIQCRQQRSIRF